MASHRRAVPPFVHLAAHPLRWRLLTELSGGDYRVRELVTRVNEPQNLVSYHLRLLRDGGLVTTSRSSHDRRDSYYHLDLARSAEMIAGAGTTLHPALGLELAPRGFDLPSAPAVLFVCTGNSARSVIAESLLRRRTGGRVEVFSAGTHPMPQTHADTVRVLRDEYDIDIADRIPRPLDLLAGHRFDIVITLCDKAREVCPDFGDGPRQVHWSIPDPAAPNTPGADAYPAFQATAAEIDTRIRYLLPTLTTLETACPAG
ncbi:ArsR family transcriptional regulator [Nocardia sp. 2]|uniref:ArsR family transcriptional regulator n=1 Tax=Nocardia acididurans TaxID=2802282 RepID=A0ABS1M5R6_9NOCA|nr:ArsR family transcriptional regulator [Nocardia acididurans]MBL1075992.1 ArsR family transcriptional regulator [Nocardia acididurans]